MITKRFVLILSMLFASCGDDCNKIYHLSGNVMDGSSSPISGVSVAFSTALDSSKATTDVNGSYSFTVEGVGKLEGAILVFRKEGYQDVSSSAFSSREAGSDICGNITLKRDITL